MNRSAAIREYKFLVKTLPSVWERKRSDVESRIEYLSIMYNLRKVVK